MSRWMRCSVERHPSNPQAAQRAMSASLGEPGAAGLQDGAGWAQTRSLLLRAGWSPETCYSLSASQPSASASYSKSMLGSEIAFIGDDDYDGWQPIAAPGDLSPYSTISVSV